MWHVFVYICGCVGAWIKALVNNLYLPDLANLVARHPVLNFAKSPLLHNFILLDLVARHPVLNFKKVQMSITKPELVKYRIPRVEKGNDPLSKFGKEFHLFVLVVFTTFAWYNFPNLHILTFMVILTPLTCHTQT